MVFMTRAREARLTAASVATNGTAREVGVGRPASERGSPPPYESFSQAVLDSLAAHVAVLDEEGTIVAVNRAWERFARDNGDPELRWTGLGVNYLEVTRGSRGEDAAQALTGLQAVLEGSLDTFSLDYPCHSPQEERWFRMDATPLSHGEGAVVLHADVTARKRHELALQTLAETTAVSGEAFFPALARALADALGVRWAFVGRLIGAQQLEVMAAHGATAGVYALTGTLCQHVLEVGTCAFTGDVARQFPQDELLAATRARACLGTPLLGKGGKRLGFLMVLDDETLQGGFDRLQRWLFEAFAQRAADELETLETMTRLEATARANRALRSARSVGEVYELAVHEALTQTRARSANVMLYEPVTDTVKVAHSGGYASERSHGRSLPRGQGISWRVLGSGQPLYLPDLSQEPATVFFSGKRTPGAYVGAPIVGGDERVVGVLAADTAGVEAPVGQMFSVADRAYLEALAQAVSSAVARLGALEAAKSESQRFQRLAELSAQLELLDDPLTIAQTSLEALLPLTGFDQGAFWTLEGERIVPALRVGTCPPDFICLFRPRDLKAEPGLIGQAVFGRRTVVTSDYGRAEGSLAEYQSLGLKAGVVTPLMNKGSVYGVLTLDSFEKGTIITGETLHLLAATAHRVERALERATSRLALVETREAALRAMGLALEYRDSETKGHTDRVTALSVCLGRALGLTEAALRDLRWGAYLHDAGKIAIPDGLLLKPGRLTSEEFGGIKAHVLVGEEMLRQLGFLPDAVLQIVRHHHERWDGKGYPDGLKEEQIPHLARIFAVVDVYDALTSERPYKPAWGRQAALEELVAQQGRHFDPEVVAAFIRLAEDGLDRSE